ncbi:unnamed protein product [Closterium sp. NIES-53]
MARVWGCMVQYMVPQHQRGGKLVPKASWGLHLGVSPASKGWEVLDLASNRIVTTVEVIFYETQPLDDWKAERALGSVHEVSTSAVSAPSPGLLADEIDDPLDALASAPAPPHVPTSISCSKPSICIPACAVERISRPTPDTLSKSTDDNEGRHDALPSAPRIGIVDGQPAASSENGVPGVQKQAREQVTGERLTGEKISDGLSSDVVEVIGEDNNDAGESSGDSSSSDVVEFKLPSRHSTRSNFGSGGATTQLQPSALSHLLSLLPAATEFLVAGTTPPLLFPLLLPGSPLPAPAPHTKVTASLTARREPETRASTPERREKFAAVPNITLSVVPFPTGSKTSSKPFPFVCWNPLATSLDL